MASETQTDLERFLSGRDDVAALAEGWSQKSADRAFTIDWPELRDTCPEVADQLLAGPGSTTTAVQSALGAVGKREHDASILSGADIRIRNLPDEATYRVGDLRKHHLRSLVAVRGEVVSVDPVEPLLKEGAFECQRCGTVTYLPQGYGDIIEPLECEACEMQGPWLLREPQSDIGDFQAVLAKPAETVLDEPPVLPIYLEGDLVNRVGAEDEVTFTGEYRTLPISRQSETRLNAFLKARGLDVDERAEADKYDGTELRGFINEAIDRAMEAADGAFGAGREAVVMTVVDEHGARQKEVEDAIDEMDDDNEISISAGRITRFE